MDLNQRFRCYFFMEPMSLEKSLVNNSKLTYLDNEDKHYIVYEGLHIFVNYYDSKFIINPYLLNLSDELIHHLNRRINLPESDPRKIEVKLFGRHTHIWKPTYTM